MRFAIVPVLSKTLLPFRMLRQLKNILTIKKRHGWSLLKVAAGGERKEAFESILGLLRSVTTNHEVSCLR